MQKTLERRVTATMESVARAPVVFRRESGKEYEKGNFFLRALRVPLILALDILPAFLAKRIFLAFHGNNDMKVLFDNVGTFKALEILYNFNQRRITGKLNASSIFWENFLFNGVSIRNRLILVKKEIVARVRIVAQRKQVVRLLSIGSGSARPVFEAVSTLNSVPDVEILLVDMDKEAIQFSQELATTLNFNHTRWQCGNFFRIERYCKDFHPDIVEMVGLLDYLSDKQVVVLLKKIFSVLAPAGYLITGNIAPNIESPFVTKGIHWPMIYRTPEHLAALLVEAGFANIEIAQEPLKIHTVAIVQKLLDP